MYTTYLYSTIYTTYLYSTMYTTYLYTTMYTTYLYSTMYTTFYNFKSFPSWDPKKSDDHFVICMGIHVYMYRNS